LWTEVSDLTAQELGRLKPAAPRILTVNFRPARNGVRSTNRRRSSVRPVRVLRYSRLLYSLFLCLAITTFQTAGGVGLLAVSGERLAVG